MVDENKIKETKEFLTTMPEVDFCVGYGSGFVKQMGYEKYKSQRDLLIGVPNSKKFIKENIKLNSNNYSMSEKIYYKCLPFIHNMGTEINFSPYHEYKGENYKIGVFNTSYLEKELLINKDGYLPGRLAKNLAFIKVSDYHKQLIDYNRRCTLITALLLLDSKTQKKELLKTIIGFSYRGDWIKYFDLEDEDKLDKILNESYEELEKIYTNDDLYTTDCFGRITKIFNLDDYIDGLQQDFFKYLDKYEYKHRNYENRKSMIESYLFKKNFIVTPIQGLKGIISVGPTKLNKYTEDKVSKLQIKQN